MRTDEFDYVLPEDRIAQVPAEPRDAARLLVLRRASDAPLEHARFADLDGLLDRGDLLVANDSRVIPARIRGRKLDSGGAIEALLLRPRGRLVWEALVRGRVRSGTRLVFDAPRAEVSGEPGDAGQDVGDTLQAVVLEAMADGRRVLRFERPPLDRLDRLGEVPLPPYIVEPIASPERYQTVYARVAGSVASPTAGLHFTPELIARLQARGVGFQFVTLHVGLDTFRPMQAARIENHVMHTEWCRVPARTARAVRRAHAEGHRVVAVGTTAVRALETAASQGESVGIEPYDGWTALYIRPGHEFRAVDALITNFHFPRSSLLVLVSAFAGKDRIDDAYRIALETGYRFLSFGDAMLIL